jgi:hypothetical protein
LTTTALPQAYARWSSALSSVNDISPHFWAADLTDSSANAAFSSTQPHHPGHIDNSLFNYIRLKTGKDRLGPYRNTAPCLPNQMNPYFQYSEWTEAEAFHRVWAWPWTQHSLLR